MELRIVIGAEPELIKALASINQILSRVDQTQTVASDNSLGATGKVTTLEDDDGAPKRKRRTKAEMLAAKKTAEDEETDEDEEMDDEGDALDDESESDDTDENEDDSEDDESEDSEEDEDETPAKRSNGKVISLDDVQASLKAYAKKKGGDKAARLKAIGLLKKIGGVTEVNKLKPTKYAAVIAATQ